MGTIVLMTTTDPKQKFRTGLGNRMESVRDGLGWTQKQMADALGVEKWDTYKKWEAGTSTMPHHLIPRFCELTNTDPWWLLTGRHGGFSPKPAPRPTPFKKRA